MNREFIPFGLIIGLFCFALSATGNNANLDDPYAADQISAKADTLPPPPERFEDFINGRSNNPFDLKDPGIIEKKVEYDPATGQYIITEKIGDDYFRPPTYMTFEEYIEWQRKEEERAYFNQLAGVSTAAGELSANDPLKKIDVQSSLLDRLFGGTTVDIRPQGSIDLTFGVNFQRVDNPILTERQRRLGGFDFDMDIQMNVTGKIGEKLNLTTNYNTSATFDFDNQIKLDYNSDLFSEDEILKKIEAGNVSLPLRGSLIQGAQSLFGLKTELQFGHLRLTAIASQQQSQRENIQIEGGSQLQEFEVKADEYDENRHFFLSHYNRDNFEQSMVNLPQINTLFTIQNLEVWITNDRNEVDDVRDIVAFADLGEPERFVNPDLEPFPTPRYREICDGKPLPDNEANPLYARLLEDESLRDIDQTVSRLQGNEFNLQQARDFEKVSARKLRPTEYTFHPELGFISVNINVQPDQVLAVSFQYTYNGNIFKVGELSINTEATDVELSQNPADTIPDTETQVLFTKMLKSTTQRTDVPTWDLMMKNVYSIGAFQVNREDFKLDVFYEDPGKGDKRFLPESNLVGEPLIRVFNLDRLNVVGDPTPDGVFDFVPGITINTRNGRIMFPVLEPFGSHLERLIDDPILDTVYAYPQLYDETLFQARDNPEKNRFVIRGSYKSSVSSEISLGAFNIPPGSVQVSAGGQRLIEGRDFEVDYNTGRVKILNDAILSSGVPINVSFEDNTLFGFQTKTMLGLRADYEVDENFSVGATLLKLFERPFTQKVNIGDDPINNNIYGLDFSLSREAPWLTKAVDAIPFINTKAPSNISVTGEAAYLNPGHSRAINNSTTDEKGGIVYVDDFEGSASSFDLRQPTNLWYLASVPQNDAEDNNPLFPEATSGDLSSGANRARLNWYRIDQSARSSTDNNDPYTSLVPQIEVFPNVQVQPDQLPNIQTFDLSFYPGERGPYNFDIPNGFPDLTQGVSFNGDSLVLNDPRTRWGGIMRELNTNDFQSANIEFLEFWMLSPFLDPSDPRNPNPPNVDGQQGTLYINLGNISEDILKDSRKFFENGLPGPANPDRRVDTTIWSVVPVGQQITRAFDNDPETRILQDVGLDGLNNEGERQKFSDYLEAIRNANSVVADKLANDPAFDDFRYYRDGSFAEDAGIRARYRDFNNTEGNSQSNQGNDIRQSGTNIPDTEDLNRDNTLNETESYFQYAVPLVANAFDRRELDTELTPFITDRLEADNGRVWYRFRIPLRGPQKTAVGGIRDFRSIRFMRMYMRGFAAPTILRFARMELVRNQWRRYDDDESQLNELSRTCEEPLTFDVDAVNIEENSSRTPFNYVLPVGIQREQSLGVFNTLQNEQSLSIKLENLCRGEAKAIFKNTEFDMRLYERFRMFVHAEEKDEQEIPDGGLRVFVRLGSDFLENYYEYEIPLVMSEEDNLPANRNSDEYKNEVWRPENGFDFSLKDLVAFKEERNAQDFPTTDEFIRVLSPDNPSMSHAMKVKGNPNLGRVKIVMVGIRYPADDRAPGTGTETFDTEVWINEMRLTGLDERGGLAALARVDMQLADFGSLTLSGNYSSIGFGALDQNVTERARESTTGLDFAAQLNLDKFFPQKWGLRIPFYLQFSNTTKTPEYDPYDLDVVLKDKLNRIEDKTVRDSVREQTQEIVKLKSFNFTNVRKERTGRGKPMPWNIENFSFSYSFTQTDRSDPIIEFDRERKYTGTINYNYSKGATYIQPFKNLIKNDKFLKLIKEININPLPNSFSFSSVMDRRFAQTRYRFAGVEERFNTFFNKRFTWDRDYDLQWDLTRSLKINFNAVASAIIDEPDEIKLLEDPNIQDIGRFRRDSIWNNIKKLGRPKNYRHQLSVSYNLPLRFLPFMDWVQARANYNSDYSWNAAALNTDSLGNIIQNSQQRQLTTDFNFERLYDKIPYFKKLNKKNNQSRNRSRNRTRPQRDNSKDKQGEEDQKKKKRGKGEPGVLEQILVRPLLSLRRIRFNYSEQFRTVVPGFTPDPKLLGMSSGFGAPGWGFAFGLQPKIRELSDDVRFGLASDPDDWLQQNSDWITQSVFLNQEVIQEYTQTYDAKVTLEPWQDFRIELEANRSFTDNYSEFFKDTLKNGEVDFVHAAPRNFGSMTVSYSALSTLFQDDRESITALFSQFETNRSIISQRLGNGVHTEEDQAAQGYTFGFGRAQQDVLIPAFIAAYTGQDPNKVSLDIFDTKPRVNWRVTYNGLSRLPFFKDIFQNFSLTHGYKSTLTVNSFRSGLDFLDTRDPVTGIGGFDDLNGNFYARLEIPEVAIQEAFSPLIALDATLTNGMSFNIDYKKSRSLAMSFISKQLSETQTTEFVIGFGFLMRGVDIAFLTGSKKKKKRGRTDQNNPQRNRNNNRRGGSSSALQGQDLDIQFNFSLRDDVTFNHILDQGIREPTRGNYALSLSPSAEYQLNQRLSLRLFFDYRRNVPKTSAGFPRTDTSGGIIVRFQLN